jgi:hypothetical protein
LAGTKELIEPSKLAEKKNIMQNKDQTISRIRVLPTDRKKKGKNLGEREGLPKKVPMTFASSFAESRFPNCIEHVISLDVLNSDRQSNFCPPCDSISKQKEKVVKH